MEEKITKEFVDELMKWGEERLAKKDLPKEPVKMNISHSITNCEVYVDSMMHTLSRHWENPLFRPMLDEFCEFRERITS